jgi:hypothetical protein
MQNQSAIIVSARVCERVCQNAIIYFEDLIAREWELQIYQEMIKKPFLWVFNKPALSKEEAISRIEKKFQTLKPNAFLFEPGFEYLYSLSVAKKIYAMCRHCNELYITQEDFSILEPFFPVSQAMYR